MIQTTPLILVTTLVYESHVHGSNRDSKTVLCKSTRMMMLADPSPKCARCMSLPKVNIPKSLNNPYRHRSKYWAIDSGASIHGVSDLAMLTSVYYKHPPVIITVADNRTLSAQAVGTAILPLLVR